MFAISYMSPTELVWSLNTFGSLRPSLHELRCSWASLLSSAGSGDGFRQVFILCTDIVNSAAMLGKWCPTVFAFCVQSSQMVFVFVQIVVQRGPNAFQRNQAATKETQGSKRNPKDTQRRSTIPNHIFAQTMHSQTSDPPPKGGFLVTLIRGIPQKIIK